MKNSASILANKVKTKQCRTKRSLWRRSQALPNWPAFPTSASNISLSPSDYSRTVPTPPTVPKMSQTGLVPARTEPAFLLESSISNTFLSRIMEGERERRIDWFPSVRVYWGHTWKFKWKFNERRGLLSLLLYPLLFSYCINYLHIPVIINTKLKINVPTHSWSFKCG